MEDAYLQSLLQHKAMLEGIIREKKKPLQNIPKGHLRISNKAGNTQFYYAEAGKDRIYLPKKDYKRIIRLAQADYDGDICRAAQRELDALNHLLTSYQKHNVYAEDQSLHHSRRELISPICLLDEELVAKWAREQYTSNPYQLSEGAQQTELGELVRSKSEMMIANALHHLGIPYHYEYPLQLKTLSGKTIMKYPDFKTVNLRNRKQYYWEHFGRMSDEDYVDDMIQKLRLYEANGIFPGDPVTPEGFGLIITHESRDRAFTSTQLDAVIKRYLL